MDVKTFTANERRYKMSKERNQGSGIYYKLFPFFVDKITIEPSIPVNFFTLNGYEDNMTERVVLCPSIEDCLCAMSRNIDYKLFAVYTPAKPIGAFYKPNEIDCIDCKIINEIWVKEPILLKCIGYVDVSADSYEYGTININNKTITLYSWKYTFHKGESPFNI